MYICRQEDAKAIESANKQSDAVERDKLSWKRLAAKNAVATQEEAIRQVNIHACTCILDIHMSRP